MLGAVEESEQRAKALATEDESRVGIDTNLDFVVSAPNDWRVRHQLWMLKRRMWDGSRCRCAHLASLRPAACDKRAIHSRVNLALHCVAQ